MKVLVTGATGFTGSYIVPLLLQEKMQVSCFVRRSSDLSQLPVNQVQLTYGDLSDHSSLIAALTGVDVLVNIASLGFGHAENIVSATVQAGVTRAIFVSTTAIFTQLNTTSKSTRLAAEAIVHQSNLDYTILRPTMIYGSSRDRNICRLINYLLRWPLIPIFGNGQSLQQPIYVEDVARAVLLSILTEQTVQKSYNISGATSLTYNQIIDIVCERIKRKVHKLHVPYLPIVTCLNTLERLSLPLPIKAEQILRLNENKNFTHAEATKDFGFQPLSFIEGISLEWASIQTGKK